MKFTIPQKSTRKFDGKAPNLITLVSETFKFSRPTSASVGDWAIEIDTSLVREKGCAKYGSFHLKCVIYISNKIFEISDLP